MQTRVSGSNEAKNRKGKNENMIKCNKCDYTIDEKTKGEHKLNELLVSHITKHNNEELIKENFTVKKEASK